MPTVAGELRTSTEDAGDCAELASFACGDGRIEAEETVNAIVTGYATGAGSPSFLRVTREHPSGNLVGVVGVKDGGVGYDHQLFQMADWKDPVYIAVIALSAQYRGGFKAQDGSPLSHVLLRDALRFAASREAGTVPSMQAVIAPDNTPSRRLFEEHGFEMIPTNPDLLYVRPRGLAIPGE